MRTSVCFVLFALISNACLAQSRIRVERNAEGTAISASFTGKSNLDRLELTPRTLDAVARLSELQSVTLWGTNVSDAEILRLLPLKHLLSIDLSYTNVTGNVLTTLSRMPQLAIINLEGCQVDDKHLEQLSGLERLITLRLAKTNVTDKGLKHIEKLKNLIQLDLSACEVSDDGLRSLGHMPKIRHLWLSKTIRYGQDDRSELTDGCIDYLASLTTLIDLQIASSRISDEGLKRLKLALPDAKISTEPNGVVYLDRKKPDRTKR